VYSRAKLNDDSTRAMLLWLGHALQLSFIRSTGRSPARYPSSMIVQYVQLHSLATGIAKSISASLPYYGPEINTP
jgi:hypothetical protein